MTDEAQDEFEQAVQRVKDLSKTPAPDELLELYALFKQGRQGDAQGKRPGLLDVRGRAKFDAWSAKRGMTAEAARGAYVDLVARLESKYGT